MHGPTFMGNPLACAIASKSLEIIQRNEWKSQVKSIEEIFNQKLDKAQDISIIKDTRVIGAIAVFELSIPVDMKWFREKFLEKGIWVRPFGKLVYLMPPFIISEKELNHLVDSVIEIIIEFDNLQKEQQNINL